MCNHTRKIKCVNLDEYVGKLTKRLVLVWNDLQKCSIDVIFEQGPACQKIFKSSISRVTLAETDDCFSTSNKIKEMYSENIFIIYLLASRPHAWRVMVYCWIAWWLHWFLSWLQWRRSVLVSSVPRTGRGRPSAQSDIQYRPVSRDLQTQNSMMHHAHHV